MTPKFIIVSGGVISGVGKGIASASIARILQEYGFSVTAIKIDPYINFDAGTMRPTEHGEVWVTDDGGEIDQDLGNYERFLGFSIPKKNNLTTGQIYGTIIERERNGGYLGQTVQFIPHVPEEIKRRIYEASFGYDFAVVEIGGTIGDYENLPFLFAAKSLQIELGWENVCHVLVSYLPIPGNIGEMKSKPTQQAIRTLMETGIIPDFVLCRATKPLDEPRKKKIQVYANIDAEHIISAPDVNTIYSVPLNFERDKLGEKLLKRMNIQQKKIPDWSQWKELVNHIEHPSRILNIAMIGKYLDIGEFTLTDSYISINQALEHAGARLDASVRISWIDSKKFESNSSELEVLKNYSGIIIPGGFGSSGVEGKINAIKFARENNIPFLGLCYGMQLAVVEFARNVCSMSGANTTEVDPNTIYPVIDIIPSQKKLMEENRYGGTMRLGAYAAKLREKTQVWDLYKRTGRMERDMKQLEIINLTTQIFRIGNNNASGTIIERHRHRYEVNPNFIDFITKKGLVFSGIHERADGTELMEFIELPEHKFFVATQSHPEFKSRLEDPAPLFIGFVEACLQN